MAKKSTYELKSSTCLCCEYGTLEQLIMKLHWKLPMFKRRGCRYRMDSNYESDGGTDDDLPLTILQKQVLKARGASARQPSGTKRPGSGMHLDRFSAMEDGTTQELEMDAYSAVLRAFCAQSTALTWTKERLMCDLRKELRISEKQHRQLTEELEARQARSLRYGAVPEAGATFDMQIATALLLPSNTDLPTYQKNPRASHAHQAPLVVPVAPFELPTTQSSYESSRSQANRGKSRQAPGPVTAPSPSKFSLNGSALIGHPKLQRLLNGDTAAPSKDLNGELEGSDPEKDRTNLRLCRESFAVAPVLRTLASEMQVGPYLGRRLQRLWPDDKIFYDAVIVEYDQESDKHALVYDMGTPQESYEWVNLKEVAEGEVKFVQGPAISLLGRNLEPPPPRGLGRGRRGGRLAIGQGRGKSYWRSPVSAPARVPSSVKLVNVGPGKTLRKQFQDAVAVKERDLDLKERKRLVCSNSSEHSVHVNELVMNERGLEDTTVKVPVISDILAEAKNLDEIVDLDKLANMKHTVGVIAEALRTALHDLGDSSDEEDHDVEDIKSSDEETEEKKTSQRGKLLQ